MRKAWLTDLLIVAAAASALAAVYWYQKHWLFRVGLSLDDAYIHLQYSRNIIAGKWMVYTENQPRTPGDTSPLWIFLIAGFGYIFRDLMAVSLALGGIFYALTGIFAFELGKKFLKSEMSALAYSLVVVLTGRLLWTATSGMEGTLFSFLCLLGVLLYQRGKEQGRFSIASAIVFGLAGNARPEGNLLFVFALADWVLAEKMWREKSYKLSSIPWAAGAAFSVLVLPYLLFSFFATGHFTPNTFRATKLPFDLTRSWRYLKLVAQFLYHDHLLLHIALPVGIIVFIAALFRRGEKERRYFLVWLWPIGYLATSFFFAPIIFHFQRYLIPVLPFFVLLSFYGLEWLVERLKVILSPANIARVKYALFMVMVVWAGVVTFWGWPLMAAQCVKNIDEMQVKLGHWVKDNTAPSDVIAVNDIGAIFYISDRPGLDLVGLVNPELLAKVQGLKMPSARRDQITFEYLLEKRPAYLIVFPSWFPAIVAHEEIFKPVYSVTITDNLICPDDTMVVYKCFWPVK
jgi:hypothetical protein